MNPSLTSNEIAALPKQAAISQQQGKLQEAFDLYQQSLDAEPDNFVALHAMGVLCGQAGRLDDALKFFAAAGAVQPTDAGVYFNMGTVLSMLGRPDDALASYDKALSLKPDFAAAHNNRGNVLKDLHRYEEAMASYTKAIAFRRDYANAYNNLGAIQILLHRYDEAIASYDKLLLLRPDFVEAHNSRAAALKALGRHEEALAGYDNVITLNATSADAHHQRAAELEALTRFDEALTAYDRAIALKPDAAESHSNRGNVLKALRRYDEALAAYAKAIAIKPDVAAMYNNQGNLFLELGRRQEALANFDHAIALNAEFAEAHYNKSLLLLLLGNYREAWPLHEWRWKTGEQQRFARNFQQPLWLNDAELDGRTILLHAEQGLGDTIQFARYIPLVKAMGAQVIVEAPASLIPLLRTLKGTFTLIESGNPLPGFDCHCPLMSLPLAFHTTIDTIPVKIPYLFADPRRQSMWRERLGPKIKPRVGLAWSGFTRHINDRHRSMTFRTLKPLLQLDCEFHSLQKEIRPEDRDALTESPQIQIHTDELRDFADTAALIAELDIVISVDTSVAHVAGALGKPLWLLLSYVVDSRWLTERSDSPWYPTARLFRQDRIGDWSTVIENVKSVLHDAR
jgi:tetratricopeptide (TPR) repeat protein